MTVNAELAKNEIKIAGPDKEGWYDAEVKELTKETAIQVLKQITRADEIEINEKNVCTSV